MNRRVISAVAPAVLLVLASGYQLDAQVRQEMAQGYVFEDQNGNGQRDAGEPGLSGVGVSNGREVVLTDQEGRYQLPVECSGSTLFVIKPSGYQSPLSKDYTPLFYYSYKPLGSPEGLKYKAFEPTGPLPKEVNFPLRKTGEPSKYSVMVFGDPQPHSETDVSYFGGKVIADVQRRIPEDAIFGISLGDLAWDYLDLEPLYMREVAKLQLPWHNVLGNHDMNVDRFILDDKDSDETFEYYYGPATYAFNYGDVHYVIMDDVLFPDPGGRTKYWGGYRKDQLDFLESDLKHVRPDQLIVLSQHIHLGDAGGTDDHFRRSDRERLFRILSRFDHVLVFSAHTHVQQLIEYGPEDGWRGKNPLLEINIGTTCGDWFSGKIGADGFPDATMRDGTPQGFGILRVDGNRYALDYRVVGMPDDYQIRVTAPNVVAAGKGTSARVLANIFMCQEGDKVEYRIGQGEWRPMSYAPGTPDPHYLNLLHEWDYSDELLPGRRPSNAVPSTHIWSGRIDSKLTPGTYTIEVRATDRFGRQHHGTTRMRVE